VCDALEVVDDGAELFDGHLLRQGCETDQVDKADRDDDRHGRARLGPTAPVPFDRLLHVHAQHDLHARRERA
jgi:hypothetical protein